jgi:methionyl-tRNA formyltransferase
MSAPAIDKGLGEFLSNEVGIHVSAPETTEDRMVSVPRRVVTAPNLRNLTLFLMTQKGHAALQGIIARVGADAVGAVVSCRDHGVRNDCYEEIRGTCKEAAIPFFDRRSNDSLLTDSALAVSWRWMIRGVPNLVVFHDSLLPRYRGFAPLPNALINGEPMIGVSALFAGDDYDTGDIICQKSVRVEYPIKIQKAIDDLLPLYTELGAELASAICSGVELRGQKQDDSQASYSLWRDEADYQIEWSWDSERIARFIDAVGHPYLGARSNLNHEEVIIRESVVEPDVCVENRTPGKVIFMRGDHPVVTCGRGLLRIVRLEDREGRSLLPLKKFRLRFGF